MEPGEALLDPVVALTYLAARTTRIRLATGCVVLPQRNPLVLAKQLASVDVLSGGRLIFGTAVGYLEPELRALGVPLARRGARTDEYLRAIQSLWYDENPAIDGEFVSFSGVDAHPRPVQRPVPLVIGGHSAAALRRAVSFGADWFGYLLGLRATAPILAELTRVVEAARGGRRPRVSITPSRRLDADSVRSYGELGVDRLVVAPLPTWTVDQIAEFVEANAPARLGATPA